MSTLTNIVRSLLHERDWWLALMNETTSPYVQQTAGSRVDRLTDELIARIPLLVKQLEAQEQMALEPSLLDAPITHDQAPTLHLCHCKKEATR